MYQLIIKRKIGIKNIFLHREMIYRNVLIVNVLTKLKYFPKLSTKCFVPHCVSMDYVNSHCN